MENILIFGGAGLIGSELINRLAKSDLQIISIDKKKQDYPSLQNVNSYELNITKSSSLSVIERLIIEADVIFFKIALLGNPNLSSNYLYAKEFFDVNTLAFLSIVNIIKRSKVSKVIIDSSISAISNINNSINMEETRSNYQAMNYYGLSKLLLEDIINFSFKDTSKCISVFRYPRVFSIKLKNVIYYIVKGIVKDRKAIIIGNPDKRLDFVHINDVINVNEQMIYINEGEGINYCHLTSGNSISLIELVGFVKQTLNISYVIDIIYKNDQVIVNEPINNSLSMEKTKMKFGFQVHKNLKDMIIEVYKEVFIKHGHNYG